MRLSESLKKNITESSVGNIKNKFKMKHRRDALFFEDILANYVKLCQENGHEKEMFEIGQKWLDLSLNQVIKPIFKKAPILFLNTVLKKVWLNLCIIDDLKSEKKEDIVIIETKGEALTRVLGPNSLMQGTYLGIINVVFDSEAELLEVHQTKEKSSYKFRIIEKPFVHFKAKEKYLYDKLNKQIDASGPSLKNALKHGIFKLDKKNKIFFRGKHIIIGESTLNHLISNRNIMIEKVPEISFEYFSSLIKKETSKEEKLILIKTLLQIMGWGKIIFSESGKKIFMDISNPPYGLQIEEDNWNFMINCVLGYLWTLDKDFRIEKIVKKYKRLNVNFSKV